MVTLVSLALAALLWLLLLTLGDDPHAYGPLQPQWIADAALGLSVLAAVLIVRRLLGHVLPGAGRGDRRATSDLLQAVISIVLYAVAAMLYLSLGLHLDITSVLATSAVLSVIVGLALQPTLGNLFAGVSIEIERPVREGAFVRRDTVEGQVVSLRWRSVCLQTDRGSRVVLPNNEFNSRLVEVIPASRPYRHQVEFQLAADLPPTAIMRVAMQVLCSDLPGICTAPAPSVVLIATDTATATLRYAARFYTLQFLDRTSIASGFLERFWYALGRERLHGNAWRPALDVNVRPADGQRAGGTMPADVGDAGTAAASPARIAPAASTGVAATALVDLPAALRQALPASAQTLHYGPAERCEAARVACVLQGGLSEARPMPAAEREARFAALLQALDGADPGSGPLCLDAAAYQDLLHAGTLVLGPLAHALCQRIALHTADPHLAYRAFAESIPNPAQRAQFLAKAPIQAHRLVRTGAWLGWAQVLELETELRECRAGAQGCTLLVWSAPAIRTALAALASPQRDALAQWLVHDMPGCAALTPTRLQAWIERA